MPKLLQNPHLAQLVTLSVLLSLFVGPTTAVAQDQVYSQFYAAPLQLNPALAGTTRAPLISLNHRSQYLNFARTIPYQTYSASYTQLLAPIRSGIGLTVMADDAGDGLVSTYAASAYYAYHIRIDDQQSIRAGISAGVQQKRIEYNRLVFFDQLNPITGQVDEAGNPNPTNELRPAAESVTYADFGAGIVYAGPDYFAGLSVSHLTTPDDRFVSAGPEGFYKGLPMRINVHGGAQIKLSKSRAADQRYITPNVLFTKQGAFEQLNLGAYISFGRLFSGAWFRHTFGNADALIGVVGVEWDMYKFGYSYDFVVSDLAPVNNGTHEVSLQINFDKAPWIKEKRKALRYNDCLNLFR